MDINDTPQDSMSFSSRRVPGGSKTLLIVGGIIAALLLGFIVKYAIGQSVISEGNGKEAKLSADYSDAANFMANCNKKARQAANVAQANADAFDKVIRDAVAGTGEAGKFNLKTPEGRAGLMPLLVQAWPDFKNSTDLFEKVTNAVLGCQDDFRGKQSLVLEGVREFVKWKNGSWKVRNFGGEDFPNDVLVINIPGVPQLKGAAALTKISTPIVDSATSDAYATGIDKSGDTPLFGTTPTPSTTP